MRKDCSVRVNLCNTKISNTYTSCSNNSSECLRNSTENMAKVAATIDWSELPEELMVLIIRRLDHFPVAHARFGLVCKSWRLVAIPNRCHLRYKQLSVGLMVPGITNNSRIRRFFLLNYESGFFEEEKGNQDANSREQLEVPHGCCCRGSAYGWLFLVDNDLNTKLLNPFTTAEIQLPSVATLPSPLTGYFNKHRDKWCVKKAIFSSNPSCLQLQPLALPVILIIYGGIGERMLAYCKPGDESWMALEYFHKKYYFTDAIYYKDRFLALDSNGEIMALHIGNSNHSTSTHTNDQKCEVKVTQYACVPGSQYLEHTPMFEFLVELQGDLVVLTKKQRDCDEDFDMYDNYEGKDYRGASSYGKVRTAEFRMLMFEMNKQKWVEVKSIGNNVLFLGYNTSFSLRKASEYLGCIPNSIYFTNDSDGEYYGYDMGIYNLTDNSITRLYPIGSQLTCPTPIWVTRVPFRC